MAGAWDRFKRDALAKRAKPIAVQLDGFEGPHYVLRLMAAQVDDQALLRARREKNPDYVDRFATARQCAFVLCDENGERLRDPENEEHLQELKEMLEWKDMKKLLDSAVPTATESGGVVSDLKNSPTESVSTST